MGLSNSETPSFSDQAVLAIGKILTENPAITDIHVTAFGKVLTESPSISDSHALGVAKVLSETSSLTDSGIVLKQDYCADYFSDDYIGTKTTF